MSLEKIKEYEPLIIDIVMSKTDDDTPVVSFTIGETDTEHMNYEIELRDIDLKLILEYLSNHS